MSDGNIVGRRALIASAAALAAGLIAKQTAQPVEAATTMMTDTNNVASAITGIITPGAVGFQAQSTAAAGTGLVGFNTAGGIGTKGLSDNVGVQGGVGALGAVSAGFTIGVQGVNFATGASNTGVQGLIDSIATSAAPNTTPNSIGVEGRNNSSGAGSIGVLGTIGPYTGHEPDTSNGVGGLNLSTGRVTFGVTGEVHGASGAGIIGAAHGPTGVGLQGQSDNGSGLTGVSYAANGSDAGIFAYAAVAGGIAFQASGAAGSRAGIFYGDVNVNGTLTATVKHAVVPFPDGEHRLLYCMEAPEPWFEDFGEGQLVRGKAEVQIEPHFAMTTDLSAYHVFLTAHGNTNGLHLTNRGATGFTVEEHNGGESNLTFSYRIVAKRNDIAGERFPKFVKREAPEPPPIYELPVPEQYQEMRRAVIAANKK